MNSKRSISPDEFKELTRPQLRLFLSADLENSTRLKQSLAKDNSQEWLITVIRFVEEFPRLLRAQGERLSRERHHQVDPPSLWKILGDELVFSAEIKHLTDAGLQIEAFRAAIAAWNREAREKNEKTGRRLLIKGTAWAAGFPVTNAVLPTDAGGKDYVGPSMDAGFRIAKLATPRHLIVSVDAAWMLLKAPEDFGLKAKLHYEGGAKLKSIAEDSGYPELWLEVENSDFQRIEAELRGQGAQKIAGSLEKLCQTFMQEYGIPSHVPFLPTDGVFNSMPVGYAERLEVMSQFLREEVYFVSEESPTGLNIAEELAESSQLLAKLPTSNDSH